MTNRRNTGCGQSELIDTVAAAVIEGLTKDSQSKELITARAIAAASFLRQEDVSFDLFRAVVEDTVSELLARLLAIGWLSRLPDAELYSLTCYGRTESERHTEGDWISGVIAASDTLLQTDIRTGAAVSATLLTPFQKRAISWDVQRVHIVTDREQISKADDTITFGARRNEHGSHP